MNRKTTPEGIEERVRILSKYVDLDRKYLTEKKNALSCNPDDILDAVCLAVTACLAASGKAEIIPSDPMQDTRGLYMQMVIPKPQSQRAQIE